MKTQMKDKQIRKILISYLLAEHKEIRIYQEKSIGSSVCDVMAVTDCLTGYEIKSDTDNYNRLESQIQAYDRFFDRNYIVIGANHRKSIEERIPAYWGIMIIEKDCITVQRDAQKPPKSLPYRRYQLDILWKLELKNLLIKEDLPSYTYKDKAYIIRQIMEYVEDAEIQKHVVYELMHRDYSLYDAKDYTIYSPGTQAISESALEGLPTSEIIDTLSEKNLEEFTLDQWIALYRQAKEVQRNKEALSRSIPKEKPKNLVPYTEIEVSPGVPWVSRRIIEAFVYYLGTGKEYTSVAAQRLVNYEPITGAWHINNKASDVLWIDQHYVPLDRMRLTHTYGLPRYNAFFIFEAMLNLREIKLYDKNNVYSEKDTVAALEKQEAILQLFQKWIWEDEDRRWEVEKAYSDLFGRFQPRSYDGTTLAFPEMSEQIQLYPYQKDAVQKILTEKNTLLAFDVGAGKTYIMIAAAMKLRQEGLARKNVFVVPNNIVGQWELIFKAMYPRAKVLSVEPKSFKPEMRQKVLGQIRDGDYDGIVIAYSCFEMIPLSSNHIMEQMNRNLLNIETVMRNVRLESGSHTALQREAAFIKKQAAELIDAMTALPNEITFEELEINTLFVDEAHNFKNIPLRTNMRNLAGINIKGSPKCLEMLHKVRAVQEANNGRGVVFATGTPLCNSISDAYAMQLYLQHDVMRETHLDRFDNWVKSFAKPERVCEIDVDTSKFRFRNRFSKFFNLPELSKMFADIAIFHAVDEKDLPEMEGYDNILIQQNAALQRYMEKLCERTEKIREMAVEKAADNMLKVSTDGRKAALDLRLVGEEQPYDRSSKLLHCVEHVLEIYRKEPGCTQVVFCDLSTPKGNEFNVYADLKDRLSEAGIPEKEIAFIHSYHSEAHKVALYEKVNRGDVRVLIGSTFKLGIGANIQTKLKAVHHLDIPWRPADMVQREGRILRKGNTNESIRIFRYITEGSFDAYSWQILEAKQRFISQFLSGSSYQRSASDLDETILTYAQVKALAISEPLMKELAEKQNELQRLLILSSGYADIRKDLEEKLPKKEAELHLLENRYAAGVENARHIHTFSEADYQQAYDTLKTVLPASALNGTTEFHKDLQVLGFQLSLPDTQDSEHPILLLGREQAEYAVKTGNSAHGNARRILNFLKQFDNLLGDLTQQMEKLKQEIAAYKEMQKQENPYNAQILARKDEIAALQSKIDIWDDTEPIV